MKKLLLAILTLMFILTGCTDSKDPQEINPDPAISATIKNFLKYSSQNDWDSTLKLLSGEALINARENIKFNQVKYELLNSNIDILTFNKSGTYARARADITIKSGEYTDRQFYEFELLKINGHWKIYKQKEVNPELLGLISKGNVPDRVIETVRDYITLVAAGQWIEANKFLTGQALRVAKRNYRGNVKTGMSVSQLNIEPIGVQDKIWKIKASYKINSSNQVIILNVIDLDQPKISNITLAEKGEG